MHRIVLLAAGVSIAVGLRAQDGISLAYYQHLYGSPSNAAVLVPDLAVECLLIDVMQVVMSANVCRQGALAAAIPSADARAGLIRGELAPLSAADRRAVMQFVDPVAFRPVWPRGPIGDSLEAEWFVVRRLHARESDEVGALAQFGAAVWGATASTAGGAAPFLELAGAREVFLAGVSDAEGSGIVPCLLYALGEESHALGDPVTRRRACLAAIEHWPAAVRVKGRYVGPGITNLTGHDVFVGGSAKEWQRVVEASRRWEAALMMDSSPTRRSNRGTPSTLRSVFEMLLGVASAAEPRALSPEEADRASLLVQNRTTMYPKEASGRRHAIATDRTLTFAGRRAAAFVFDEPE